MVAVDTNILVYGVRTSEPEYETARDLLTRLGKSGSAWGCAWPTIYEFIRIATHHRPYSTREILALIDRMFDSESFVVYGPTVKHWSTARRILEPIQPIANSAFDVQIASILLENRIEVLYTRDARFASFGLTVIDPFENRAGRTQPAIPGPAASRQYPRPPVSP